MHQTLQYIKALFIAFMATDLAQIVAESKWLLLAILLCVIADYRFAKGECNKRLAEAKEKGDNEGIKANTWRTSRAKRRTVSKFVDYLVWVSVGMILGAAILTPFNLPRIWGGAVATAIACLCEVQSLAGHFLFLRGIELPKQSAKSLAKHFAVSYIKRKDQDAGEALQDAFKENEEKKQ